MVRSAACNRRLIRNFEMHASRTRFPEKDLRPYNKVGYTVI